MKHLIEKWLSRTITSFLIFCAINSNASAQRHYDNIPKPEFINQFYYYQNGKLLDLESSIIAPITNVPLGRAILNGGGFNNSQVLISIKGINSKIRIPSNDTLMFVINGLCSTASVLQLLRMDKNKKVRYTVVFDENTKKPNKNLIGFNVKDLGGNIFAIVPSQKLGSGEYCLFCVMLAEL